MIPCMVSSSDPDRGDLVIPSSCHPLIPSSCHLIFAELALGNFGESSKQWLLTLIHDYAANHRIDGVILGCTELPLLLRPDDSPLLLLDTLDLHAEAALTYAYAEN